MKRVFYSVLSAAILAVMVAGCGGSGSGLGNTNAKWEYIVFNGRAGSYELEELNKTLNEYGAQGWELVSSGLSYVSSPGGSGDLYLILKRKL